MAESSFVLLGLTGHKCVGKDTTADYLCAQYGFHRLSFAGPLKHALADIFGFSDEQLNGSLKEVLDPYWQITPREAAQFVGTELFRIGLAQRFPQIGANIWTRALGRQIAQHRAEWPCIVITDIRYPNEADLIKKMGGTLIRILRDTGTHGDALASHLSEVSMDTYPTDLIIRNNSSIDDLNRAIDLIMQTKRSQIARDAYSVLPHIRSTSPRPQC